MDFLLLPGAVIGFVFGAAVGWGISMLVWGEPHVPMITTLVITCTFPVTNFDHRAHIRLAYIYLSANTTAQAVDRVRDTLTGLLKSRRNRSRPKVS